MFKRLENISFALAMYFLGATLGGWPLVYAQQQPAPQTPSEQALSTKLIEEINAGMQDRVALIAARRKLDELQKQLDDLKPKTETPKSIDSSGNAK